jgi:signal transduction histidine kinase
MWGLPGLDRAYLPSRLLSQFLVVAAILILCSMTALSYSISHVLQSSLTRAAAEEGALLLDAVLGPSIQELATAKTLSPDNTKKLDDLLRPKLGERTEALKIWLRDGTLVYSTNMQMIGEKFPSPQIASAFSGKATGTFDDLDSADHRFERQLQRPLIEIFAPLYLAGTMEVIAAGEIYNDGKRLAAELASVRIAVAVIFAAVTAPTMLVVFLIVRQAKARVAAHRNTLKNKVTEARALAAQNGKLRQQAEQSRLDSIHSNERLLNQIGQDLHDGPIQLLSILGLKLSELVDANGPSIVLEQSQSRLSPAELLAGTLVELRNLAKGLVLPQLDGLATEDTLRLAIRQHERMTGTAVRYTIGVLPACPPALKICLYRIVQEALNNAYYYANGCGQRVAASADAQWISVVISDSGRGQAEPHRVPRGEVGLGLTGLRRRVEALHGTFEVSSRADGTWVSAKIPISGSVSFS